jgi:ubiquinone/menaquinone biosynthesis C-methylase UbiE
MSSLALMRLLESAPLRYDAGIRLLTLGQIDEIRTALADAAAGAPGACVLEIGCGTGAVTEKLLVRSARVTALDQNPQMLEQARRKLTGAPRDTLKLVERTAAEIDSFDDQTFDAVVASLSLSEMSRSERAFVLQQAFRVLRPGGIVAIGDEVVPRGSAMRLWHSILRAPQAAFAWLIVGSVSRPIPELAGEIAAAGFRVRSERRWLLDSLAMVIAERPT